MKHVAFVAILSALSLAACSRGAVPTAPNAPQSSEIRSAQTITTHGNFSEYSLPAGINPSDLTRGPYDTVYFTHPGASGAPPTVWEIAATTGQVHAFTAPSPYESAGFDSIISLNRSVYYIVKIPINEDEFFFARVTPEGAFSFTGAAYFEYGLVTNLALTPDGTNFTYGYCIDPCTAPSAGVVAGAGLTDYFVPTNITGGPGGYIYATAICHGPCDPNVSDSRVYVVSTTGTIVHTFNLPNGSAPAGIVTGNDHNLWITEPGINKIARMTPTGGITQFTIPTASSGADRITYGYDGAQFFTETAANKIGRITSTGTIKEYLIPTAASQPTGIAPCSSQNCGTYGGVWFTETAANKIGRFNAPI
jgi:hypothetical protein